MFIEKCAGRRGCGLEVASYPAETNQPRPIDTTSPNQAVLHGDFQIGVMKEKSLLMKIVNPLS